MFRHQAAPLVLYVQAELQLPKEVSLLVCAEPLAALACLKVSQPKCSISEAWRSLGSHFQAVLLATFLRSAVPPVLAPAQWCTPPCRRQSWCCRHGLRCWWQGTFSHRGRSLPPGCPPPAGLVRRCLGRGSSCGVQCYVQPQPLLRREPFRKSS